MAQDIITILALVYAIGYTIVQFLYNRDYREAKQAQLDSKDAQIEFLNQQISVTLHDYQQRVKAGLENIIAAKEEENERLNQEIQRLSSPEENDILRLKIRMEIASKLADSIEKVIKIPLPSVAKFDIPDAAPSIFGAA